MRPCSELLALIPPLPAEWLALEPTRFHVCVAGDWPSRNTLKLLQKFRNRVEKSAPKERERKR